MTMNDIQFVVLVVGSTLAGYVIGAAIVLMALYYRWNRRGLI